MIYILHGENTLESYLRLKDLIESNPNLQKMYVETNSVDDLINSYETTDLLGTKKIMIGENFICKYKLSPKAFHSLETENKLVLLEKKELTKTQQINFSKIAKLEVFKLPPVLFHFLDSISPSARRSIGLLGQIGAKDNISLTWQLLNRLLTLILIKLNYNKDDVSKSLGKSFADWQWIKLREQATKFDVQKLKQLYLASLKIDYLTKTGKTSLPQKDLISVMFLKYLSP